MFYVRKKSHVDTTFWENAETWSIGRDDQASCTLHFQKMTGMIFLEQENPVEYIRKNIPQHDVGIP